MKRFRLYPVITLCFLVFFFNVCACQAQSRDELLQPQKLMDAIGVKPGMIIGEAGAGEGYFTFKLARRVGETGRVYANDIVERVFKVIERRCQRDGITNITTVLGEVEDPLFPTAELDMVFMVAAFHDFERPVKWLKNAKRYMKPDATLVIVERDPERWGQGGYHFMTREEILNTVAKSGLKLVRVDTFLSIHNIYIFKYGEQE